MKKLLNACNVKLGKYLKRRSFTIGAKAIAVRNQRKHEMGATSLTIFKRQTSNEIS